MIGLNSVASSPRAAARRPADVFDGVAQAVQALLADQLAGDVATLATINQIVAAGQPGTRDARTGDGHRVIPYIFVAPRERFTVGRLASAIYRERYAGLPGLRRAPDLALLGRLLDAARSPARGELFSYVFFAPEFAAALIEQGRKDAQWWLAQDHHDGPWRVGNPPGIPGTQSQSPMALTGRPRPPSRDRDHRCMIRADGRGRLARVADERRRRPRFATGIFLPDRYSLRVR